MKRKLLTGLFAIASLAIQAQDYYPSTATVTPTWYYNDVVGDENGSFFNPITSKYGTTIDDAGIDYQTFSSGDAYDGAFEFFLDEEDSVYTESGYYVLNGVDTTGTTITLAEQRLSDFYVSKNYYFSPTEPVVRAIFKIRNPTSVAKTTRVGIFSNMGSDGSTKMDTSSTNGSVLSNADRWMVTTDDDFSGGLPDGDPINTWVRFGPGNVRSAPIFGLKPESGNDDYLDTIPVTVPANSYVLIMQFSRMDSSTTAARNNTVKFNTVSALQTAGYLTGLSNTELEKIVNWDFTSIYCPTASPTVNVVSTSTLLCSGETATLTASGASTYAWSSTSNLPSIVITPTTTTSYTVVGTALNNCTDTTVFAQSVSPCTSVKDLTNSLVEATLAPNPTSGLLTVTSDDMNKIEVSSVSGQLVLMVETHDKTQQIDLQNFPQGIYFVKITYTNGLNVTKKVIRQ